MALDIAAGTYRPGDHLPSVRRLAVQLGINPSTVQVVLERLTALGFVETRRGLGVVVRDIDRDGGIETWGYLMRFAERLPDRATQVYADLLALRRTLVAEVLRAIASDPSRYASDRVRRSVDRLADAVRAHADEPEKLAPIEMDAFRALTVATERTAYTALLNTVGDIYLSAPRAIVAMYANPAMHVLMWTTLVTEWEARTIDERSVSRAMSWLESFDEAVVERFRDALKETTT
ncbi:MAG: GntR family transcriptional regulator [Sandaracinaceae bacterium]